MAGTNRNQIARKYDENVKWLLSEKIILAHILIHVAKEYYGMKPEAVVELKEESKEEVHSVW